MSFTTVCQPPNFVLLLFIYKLNEYYRLKKKKVLVKKVTYLPIKNYDAITTHFLTMYRAVLYCTQYYILEQGILLN